MYDILQHIGLLVLIIGIAARLEHRLTQIETRQDVLWRIFNRDTNRHHE